ncbi:hypothetical protein CI610_02039 [invertebrate metagenome]|uniref:Uncharacterized protein n=1 Tax=invertebrate metagenome TaxID=1711999 RepID=A0A2H9T6Z7_9ZZZZ
MYTLSTAIRKPLQEALQRPVKQAAVGKIENNILPALVEKGAGRLIGAEGARKVNAFVKEQGIYKGAADYLGNKAEEALLPVSQRQVEKTTEEAPGLADFCGRAVKYISAGVLPWVVRAGPGFVAGPKGVAVGLMADQAINDAGLYTKTGNALEYYAKAGVDRVVQYFNPVDRYIKGSRTEKKTSVHKRYENPVALMERLKAIHTDLRRQKRKMAKGLLTRHEADKKLHKSKMRLMRYAKLCKTYTANHNTQERIQKNIRNLLSQVDYVKTHYRPA